MPIRVNLKEIFPSDPQEINVDKVNFNFNKLLELGVGSPGPIGLTGPQGPAGPLGLVGPQGDRGATWWVDSGNPNSVTFSGPLMDGDMYLDQTSTTFEVYQYDDATSTWNSVVSIAAIVNAYLATASPSPFTTGPTGISTTSTKFVVFDTSGLTNGDYTADGVRGQFNASNNKTLFLTNFDENIITPLTEPLIWPANQNTLYTSIFKIFANHSDQQNSNFADIGRYHLELGSLYNDGTNTLLSDLKHNLKGKFYKRYLTSPQLALTNEWINTAKFSLSKPEEFSVIDLTSGVDQNGEFEFVVPKYNAESSLVREEVYVRIGSAEAFEERTNKAAILADGISITNDQVGRSMVVGLREDLGAVLDLPYSTSNFALFDVSDDVDGLFFNKTLVQTGGNFHQVITTSPIQLNIDAFYTSTTSGHFMSQGIWVGSNTVWVISGAGNTTAKASVGVLQSYDISNPKLPVRVTRIFDGKDNYASSGDFDGDQHGHNRDQYRVAIGLAKDITEYGKYIITLHHRGTPSGNNKDLLIHETDSLINSTYDVGSLSTTSTEDAYRVQVHGKYAWVITNRTYSTGPQKESVASLVAGQIASIDLTDPTLPVVIDTYIDTADTILSGWGSKYLDFDIYDNKAFVLRYTNYVDDVLFIGPDAHQLDILMFDITDPAAFSSLTRYTNPPIGAPYTTQYSPQKSLNLATLTTNTTNTEFGGICTNGRLVYAVWKNSLYLAEVTQANFLLRSTTTLSAESMNACDITVKGNYAYILINYADSTGSVQVWDISDKTSPFMVSELRNASLATSSRLVISGKYVYVVSNSGTTSELITLDITGIDSPAATIGAIKTNDLQVDGNAHIKNNLQVKNSLNVGPGGIYIDRGQGLSSDGPVLVNDAITTNITVDSANQIHGGFNTILNNINQTAVSSSQQIITKLNFFTDISMYDLLNIESTYFINSSGGTKYLRKGFVGNTIFRLGGTQGYGHPSSPLATAFTGSRISLGNGATDLIYGDLLGHDIFLGPGVQLQTNDAYGYRFSFGGSSTGTVYGLHITGADENVIEGNLQAVDSIQSGTSSKIKNQWHGWVALTYNTGQPGGPISGSNAITSAQIYVSALNLVGFNIETTTAATCGLSAVGGSQIIVAGSLQLTTPTFSDVNQVTVQLTPRYAGSSDSLLMSYSGQVSSVNDINIYWRSIVESGGIAGVGDLSFFITVTEYSNN
jgi:hypothetical protein